MVIYTIIWFGILVLRFQSQGYYNKSVTVVATSTECLVFWASLTTVFQAVNLIWLLWSYNRISILERMMQMILAFIISFSCLHLLLILFM